MNYASIILLMIQTSTLFISCYASDSLIKENVTPFSLSQIIPIDLSREHHSITVMLANFIQEYVLIPVIHIFLFKKD